MFEQSGYLGIRPDAIPPSDHYVQTCKVVGQDVGFERTRRITGYLVGNLNRFNNAKRCEERDRVKHGEVPG